VIRAKSLRSMETAFRQHTRSISNSIHHDFKGYFVATFKTLGVELRASAGKDRKSAPGGATSSASIDYKGDLKVHSSLLNVVLYDKPELRNEQN
jgi:hypothetical protein